MSHRFTEGATYETVSSTRTNGALSKPIAHSASPTSSWFFSFLKKFEKKFEKKIWKKFENKIWKNFEKKIWKNLKKIWK